MLHIARPDLQSLKGETRDTISFDFGTFFIN
jgi:hypothetical protein